MAQQCAAGAVQAGQAARQVCPARHAGQIGRPARGQQAGGGNQWGREEADSRAMSTAQHKQRSLCVSITLVHAPDDDRIKPTAVLVLFTLHSVLECFPGHITALCWGEYTPAGLMHL